jgi:hypothetical protein
LLNFVSNGSSTLLQSCAYAFSATLETKYIIYLNFGTGFCGVLISLVRLFSIWIFKNKDQIYSIFFFYGIIFVLIIINYLIYVAYLKFL